MTTELLPSFFRSNPTPSGPQAQAVVISRSCSLATMTGAEDFFDGFQCWRALGGRPDVPAALIYGGDRAFKQVHMAMYPWFVLWGVGDK